MNDLIKAMTRLARQMARLEDKRAAQRQLIAEKGAGRYDNITVFYRRRARVRAHTRAGSLVVRVNK